MTQPPVGKDEPGRAAGHLGLGGILLHDSLSHEVAASQRAGGRYVIVDAVDDNAR